MHELRTLGAVQLRDERGMDLHGELQPKRLALLIYLTHAPGRLHRRDSLMALFWPELDSRGARSSLRQSLYMLRRALGKGVLTRRGYDEITIAADRLWSDVAAFERALETGSSEHALELYRGDLLEGFHVQNVAPEFEHWLESERFRLRTQAVRAALALTDREESRGDLPAAVQWAHTATRLDPDNENLLRKLIDLLDRAGDRAGAVRTYEAFARRAREEYELEPADETQRIIESVRARGESGRSAGPTVPGILEPLTRFIGRERELAALELLLTDPETRLVTLTGLGGSGKTRLGLRIAHRWGERSEGEVALVDLGDLREPDEVLHAIAHELGLTDRDRETPREALHRYLVDRDVLLFLDGFEQARAAGRDLIRLLQAAPGLKVVVTSRAPLKISGEHEFPVGPLSLPQRHLASNAEFPLNSEAVALFVDRACAVRPDFRLTASNLDAVVEICRRLDGLPLAIELAAARVKALTPQAIARRLDDRFTLLTGGPGDRPPRQRTLEATLAWSCGLLEEDERALFRRLAVFAGGFGLDLAESLFEEEGSSGIDLVDGLAALVDHSLISQQEIVGEPRFRMLDSVHAYTRKLLSESGEEDSWRCRHAEQILVWVEDGGRHFCTPDQAVWLSHLDREHENIRGALRWTVSRRDGQVASRLGAALWPFWWVGGHLAEGRSWLEKILALEEEMPTAARARSLLGMSSLVSAAAEHQRAVKLAEESAALYQAAGDDSGFLRALEALGFLHLEAGRVEPAESAFEEVLDKSRKDQDERGQAVALNALGRVALSRGEHETAERLFRESVSMARRIEDPFSVGQGLSRLGDVARRAGALDRAESLYQEALSIHRELGQKINVGWTLSCLGRVLAERGQPSVARETYVEALSLFRDLGYSRGIARALAGLAAVALAQGDPERAARFLGGVDGLLERHGDRLDPDDASFFEDVGARAKDGLRKPKFSACWAEGRSLDADGLVALAVEEDSSVRRLASG